MSKSFAMAGLRIGWLATRDRDLLARCAAFKDYTTICSSAPSEILALIGLRARDTVLARSRAIVEANLPLLDRFFADHAGVRLGPARGGSIGFPRLLPRRPTTLRRRARRGRRRPAPAGLRVGHDGNHVRIGFGRTDLPVALERLEAFADRRLN